MAGILLILAAAQTGALGGSPALALRVDTSIDHREVRLSDVADLTMLPRALRGAAATIILAKRPGKLSQASFSDAVLLTRARALMPALGQWLPAPGGRSVHILWRADRGKTVAEGACVRALHAIAARSFLSSADFEATPCTGQPSFGARYDAVAGASRAARGIAVGEVIAPWPGLAEGQIVPGQRITIATTSGPVRVEHMVSALQATRLGQRLFVRTSEGAVQSVRLDAAR